MEENRKCHRPHFSIAPSALHSILVCLYKINIFFERIILIHDNGHTSIRHKASRAYHYYYSNGNSSVARRARHTHTHTLIYPSTLSFICCNDTKSNVFFLSICVAIENDWTHCECGVWWQQFCIAQMCHVSEWNSRADLFTNFIFEKSIGKMDYIGLKCSVAMHRWSELPNNRTTIL